MNRRGFFAIAIAEIVASVAGRTATAHTGCHCGLNCRFYSCTRSGTVSHAYDYKLYSNGGKRSNGTTIWSLIGSGTTFDVSRCDCTDGCRPPAICVEPTTGIKQRSVKTQHNSRRSRAQRSR